MMPFGTIPNVHFDLRSLSVLSAMARRPIQYSGASPSSLGASHRKFPLWETGCYCPIAFWRVRGRYLDSALARLLTPSWESCPKDIQVYIARCTCLLSETWFLVYPCWLQLMLVICNGSCLHGCYPQCFYFPYGCYPQWLHCPCSCYPHWLYFAYGCYL